MLFRDNNNYILIRGFSEDPVCFSIVAYIKLYCMTPDNCFLQWSSTLIQNLDLWKLQLRFQSLFFRRFFFSPLQPIANFAPQRTVTCLMQWVQPLTTARKRQGVHNIA